MSLNKIDKKIAESVILAQVASDGGKNIPDIQTILPTAYQAWKEGYPAKDRYIIKAINLINMSHHSKFRYYVVPGDIKESILVYFDYRDLKGRKLQISFHTFNPKIEKWISKRKYPRYTTEWTEESSREACLILRDIMYEEEEKEERRYFFYVYK